MAKKIITQTEYNRRRDEEAELYRKYEPVKYKYRDFNDYLKKKRIDDTIWTLVVLGVLFGFFSMLLYLN